jgi:hypothetical protein
MSDVVRYNSVFHSQARLLGGEDNIKKQGKTLKMGAEDKYIQQE